MPHSQSLRQALRAATRAAHQKLEAQALMKQLVSPSLTLAEYGYILRAQRAYYQVLEPILRPLESQLRDRLPDVGYRFHSRLPALERDCRWLGLIEDDPTPAGTQIFRPESPEEALGVLYVLEGASQGGRVIRRQLGLRLGLGADNGAAFFSQYLDQDCWTPLCRWLDDLSCNGPWANALAGAQRTFIGLETHFDHWQRQLSDR